MRLPLTTPSSVRRAFAAACALLLALATPGALAQTTTFTTPGDHTYTVISSGDLTITARAADGGGTFGGAVGGSGATVSATFAAQAGDVLTVVVGEAGDANGGGGGGSAVILERGGARTPWLVAGAGGGGDGTFRPGGGGISADGTPGGGAAQNTFQSGEGTRGGGEGGGGGGYGFDGGTSLGGGEGGGAGTLSGGGFGGGSDFGFNNYDGGFGFGGGGGGGNTGGGGGGYGGGYGGGFPFNNYLSGGGSSFVEASASGVVRTDGVDGGGTERDGEVTLDFAAPGTWSVRTVDAGGGTITSIDQAEALLASRPTVGTDTPDVVNYGPAFPGVSGDHFALEASGVVDVLGGTSGTFTLYVNSDDGFRLRLNGVVIGEVAGPTAGSNVAIPNVTLTDGDALRLTYFESAGGEFLRLRVGDDTGPFVGATTSGIDVAVPPPTPQTFVVTKMADTADGACDAADCSLREALAAADANTAAESDTVRFAAAVQGQTLTLGQLTLSSDVVIDAEANGGAGVTVDAGQQGFRVLEVSGGVTASLIGLTLTGGQDNVFNGGGGIRNAGTLMVQRSTVTGNAVFAGDGGGIRNDGTLIVEASTISGNSAIGDAAGGGIRNLGTLTVRASTITGNLTDGDGGGISTVGPLTVETSTITGNSAPVGGAIYVLAAVGPVAATVEHSTLAENSASSGDGLYLFENGNGTATVTLSHTILDNAQNGENVVFVNGGTLLSGGYNVSDDGTGPDDGATDLLDTAPHLGPLADNGGPTLTHLPQPGSPAIDIGGTCPTEDQRGVPAPVDGDGDGTAACDAGAVEAPPPPPNFDLRVTDTVPSGSPIVVARGGEITFTYSVTNNTQSAATGDLWFTARRPSGAVVRQQRILSGTLSGGQAITSTYVQPVPSNAPLGDYSYTLSIGRFPNAAVDTETLALQITAARAAGGAASWAVTEAEAWDEAAARAASSADLPEAFALSGAYPNPFTRAATVGFAVPEAADVRLVVYDVLGRAVAVLVEGEVEAGRHEATLDGAALPSGVYLVRLTADTGFAQTQRLTLVR